MILDQYSAIITDSTSQPAKPTWKQTCSPYIKTFMTPNTHKYTQSSTLSTHQLPIILSSAPIHPWPTHIPTPTKPPTVNLFDPYRRRLPTHGLPHWLKPWQQVGNGRAKKMDGRADWQRNNMLRICLRACSLICYLFSFKPSLPFTYMVVTCLVGKFTIIIMFFLFNYHQAIITTSLTSGVLLANDASAVPINMLSEQKWWIELEVNDFNWQNVPFHINWHHRNKKEICSETIIPTRCWYAKMEAHRQWSLKMS